MSEQLKPCPLELRQATETYGLNSQEDMMIEEISELTKALQEPEEFCASCLQYGEPAGCNLNDSCAAWEYAEQAAEAIESLQAQLAQVTEERDAAVEEISGMCWCCIHGKKYKSAPAWSDLTSCKYMNERGLVASAGRGGKNCSHWEWRGPGKEQP